MSGGGEVIIRNGTLKQWLNYEVVFGGKPTKATSYISNKEYPDYIEGGVRVKGKYLLISVALIFVALGALVG